MAAYEQLQPLAASYLSSAEASVALTRVLRAFADGRELTRQQFDELVGSEPGLGPQKDHFLDFILHGVRQALADHCLTDSELELLRYLKRLCRVQEGEFLERRLAEVSNVLLLEMARILEDRQVDSEEALHKVELQALFDLGYDEFTDLVRPRIHEVLLHLVRQVDPDQDGLVSEEDLTWYHQQILALDTVIQLGPSEGTTGPAPGYLYVLVNPSMEGMVKVGKTTRDPALRARELGAATGVPTPFLLVFELFFGDCDKAEEYVHDALEARGHRVAGNREFFRATPSETIDVVLRAKAVLAAV